MIATSELAVPGSQLGPVDFPTLGWDVIDWIEAMLVHGPGDVQGSPIVLDDEQARFICHAYRLREDGRRFIRRGVFSRPKGRAKSELAAMLACAEALAPVRFDGWNAQGDPVGRPVVSPEVACFATEEGQAGNTYDNVVYMLRHGQAFYEYHLREPDVGMTRVRIPGGGEITPETSGATSKDGGKSTFVVFDETHLWVLRALKQLHATVRRNLGKRKAAEPWSMETTTMYAVGEDSVGEETHLQVAKLLERGGPELLLARGLLFDHREAPWVERFTDDEGKPTPELVAGLRYVYGEAASWMDLDRLIEEMLDEQNTEEDSRRFWLNQPVRSADSWMDRKVWEAVGEPEELEPGTFVTLGFDGSMFDDATSLVACRVGDGRLFHVRTWERPEGKAGEGWQVPREEVSAEVERCFSDYVVWRLYGDPPYWQDDLAAWAKRWPEQVTEWWTNRERAMAAATERLYTATKAAAKLAAAGEPFQPIHNGDPLLARHVGNAKRRETRAGTLLRKETPKSPRKIDAAVTAILAYEARGDAIAAGAEPPRRKHRTASF